MKVYVAAGLAESLRASLLAAGLGLAASPGEAGCLIFFYPDPAESVHAAAEARLQYSRPALVVAGGAVPYSAWLAAQAAGVPVVAPALAAGKAAALAREWETRQGAGGPAPDAAADSARGAQSVLPGAGPVETKTPPAGAAGGATLGIPDGASSAVVSGVPGGEPPPTAPPGEAARARQDWAARETAESIFPRVADGCFNLVPARPLPNVVGSFSPAGGVGKTFMATNVASWAAKLGVRTILLDADLGYGDAASALFLGEAAREAPRPTVATWKDFDAPEQRLLAAPWELRVLPRPEDPAAEASLGAADAAELLSWAAGAFELVVVDFGVAANLPFTRAALEMCGLVLLVVDPTMKSVAKVTSFLEGDAAQMGLLSRSYLVVNRIVPASRYRAQDLARIFGFQACAAVPEDAKGANKAAKKRVPLALLGKGKACREIRRVAEEVVLAKIAGFKVDKRIEANGGDLNAEPRCYQPSKTPPQERRVFL